MGIFTKKQEYVIVTDRATTSAVRDFINKHCGDDQDIDVHVHGCLLEGDNLVTITFETYAPESMVYSELIDEFWSEYRLAIRRKMIFVFKKEAEES